MQDIFIFGGGAWGLALGFALSRKNRVFILSRRDLSNQGISKFNPQNLDSKTNREIDSKNLQKLDSTAINHNADSNNSHNLDSINSSKNIESTLQNHSKDSTNSAINNNILQNLDSKNPITNKEKSSKNPNNSILHFLDSKASENASAKPFQIDSHDFASIYKSSNNPLCIVAIASAFLREFLTNATYLKPFSHDIKILAASKGIEQGSGAFMSDILESFFEKNNMCYLAGPSFAKEVRAGLPCAVVIHSKNKILAEKYATCFPFFMKTYIQSDVVGAEIAGAYKNVIAIAGGICDGLGLGNNAKASLLSRGLVEMTRFGKFFGARTKTFLGLSGSGDLFLTSNSTMSRNYRVGFALAQNRALDSILHELGEVAEGVYSAKSITQIALKHGLYTPIASEVQAILEGCPLQVALGNLLSKR
ncbi:NAD(P)H-dependent glycerol-3-phosphate dehydrogenase [Helicobacter saguini]|uniref:Glycerol-3-phosphate dehydrogenase [NAD(P)+] n=2 Tax=Helicobacter saguini TaxID=1548018 RepID=A0A347W106_9HELI|nr:NAD(P)H-dependent glycerol-3-phosphate dehydrogenase [Helicobacter saguini]MWV66403.1 NAD(P)H-dependent glycerol-3-phosphate dehydrogenase [Helicobacter saguini]MWV68755.1 NAD(P)H-dependent glycerol-3-phosphate dehydrogenase [Helicobacter saguini]MWV71692.1 NAD(P)H-dependent glycerol-3-phosphate dehydrogenase [Helicobacter saguini]TLD91887.1 NAD(P)H-dependent glycerol-3-phosphate dehydrogenase [Helicobacter saguini]